MFLRLSPPVVVCHVHLIDFLVTFRCFGDTWQVHEILQKRIDGVVYMEEWNDIVRYMYAQPPTRPTALGHLPGRSCPLLLSSPPSMPRGRYASSDAQLILTQLREAARTHRASSAGGAPGGRATRPATADDGRLPYANLLQILLRFQLSGHMQYLAGFVHLWRQLDPRGRGWIHEGEFRQLVAALDPHKPDEQLARLLGQLDPHNHQKVIFSDCVHALTPEVHRMNENEDALALS